MSKCWCKIRFYQRHGRVCPGHPRLALPPGLKTWMPATRPGMTNERSARYRWTLASHRADFKNLAVVAGFPRDPELAPAVELCHHRHHCHNRLAPHVAEGGFHAALLAEPDQVARGRKRQFEASALAAGQRLARRHPDRIGGFPAVMGAELLRGCYGDEEPGVAPVSHALRRDPLRVGHELVERQL